MVEFCREHGIHYEVCGKVIVATKQAEILLLENLFQRGIANGLTVRQLKASEVHEFEPHVKCLSGIHVPSTGIVDFAAVCSKLAELIEENGAELRLGTKVQAFQTCSKEPFWKTFPGYFEGTLHHQLRRSAQ
jgi:(S)-2-hydroxyglutarate dehydrogenase